MRPIIFSIINIDFANNNIELLNDILWIILVPFSVGVISYESYKKQINKSNGISGIVVAVLFTFFILLFFNLFNLCGLTYSEPIFKNKYNKSIICTRTYDCGAYDSDPSTELVEMTNYYGIIICYSYVDLKTIDNNDWIKQK
ncbi:MAG: hypothetical protein WC121_02770 [Candidatus Kapaibacterium sp.]